MSDKWTDRLSEYVDGELTLAEAEALDAHLLECADCGRTVEQLRAVVTRASQVIDLPPAIDLWAGIAGRVEQASDDDATRHGVPRLTFSIPQLAAAAVVLMLLSGGSMYLMLPRDQPQAAPPAAAAQTDERVTTEEALQMTPVKVESPAAANYDVAIKELEGALSSGRAQLDTTTVRVLETNLRAIDSAITEARNALGSDPGSPYLNRYLDETMQKKIQLLRRATAIVRAQT